MNIHALDAARRRDPTSTGSIRNAFRRDAEMRLNKFLLLVKAAVIDANMLGLSHPTVTSIAMSLYPSPATSFSNWLNEAIYQTFVGRDGAWVRPHVRQASLAGTLRAQDELKNLKIATFFNNARSDLIASAAANELAGVADATVQQMGRAAVDAIQRQQKPIELLRALTDRLDKIAVTRSRSLINQTVVAAFNNAKLDIYQAAGMARVGINAEQQPHLIKRRRLIRDRELSAAAALRFREEEDVEILTAGDNDVCDECEQISQQGPYPIDEARSMIPAHANCRCEFVPSWDQRFAEVEHEEE